MRERENLHEIYVTECVFTKQTTIHPTIPLVCDTITEIDISAIGLLVYMV